MKLHPRHEIIQKAELEFLNFYVKWLEENGLTTDEFISILLAQAISLNKIALKNQTEHTP